MTTYAVTGATGALGALAVEALLARGAEPGRVVAVVRDPDRASGLAARGVDVRRADYTDPSTLVSALDGVDRLLFVSGNEVGRRVEQHRNVVAAAREAGVGRIVYTSVTRADTTGLVLAPEHRATEEILAGSGVPYTVLRNNWYTENYTDRLAEHLERGAIVSAAGDGRIGAAARADYAEAAAVALLDDAHAGRTYELGGPLITVGDLAATISEIAGRPVAYTAVGPDELAGILTGAGLDEGTARFVVAIDGSIAAGELAVASDDLPDLLGRPSTPVADTVRAAL